MKAADGLHQLGLADALEGQPMLDGTIAGSDGTGSKPAGHLYSDGDLLVGGPLHHQDSRWQRMRNDPLVRSGLINLGLILIWYFFSTLLSLFNKLVVGKEHGLMNMGPFPAPFLLSSIQFFFQHIIARVMLCSGLVRRKSDGSQSWRDYGRKVVPNGIATGLDIGFSNYSLVYITLSFYVMCKSTTPLFLLVFAISWGLEKPSWSLAAVVSVISAGLLLLVYGETQFHLVGFILVMTAAMLAGLRWTITQVLLQGTPGGAHGSKKHGGPVEVLFQLTPVMGITLALLSLGHERLWVSLPASRYFESVPMLCVTLAMIFGGAVIAFCMVVAEFALIANTSALTFMVAGTFKEIVTVAAAVVFLGEHFTWINGMGLLVLIAGVVLFNWLKYRKLKEELGTASVQPGLKLTEDAEQLCINGGSGGGANGSGSAGSEVEMNGGGVAGRGGGGAVSGTPRGEHHAVLMLGVREGFLVEDEQLLQGQSPRSPRGSWRGVAGAQRQRGRTAGLPDGQHSS